MLIVAHRTDAKESRDHPVDCWRDDWRYTFDVRDKRSPSWLVIIFVVRVLCTSWMSIRH